MDSPIKYYLYDAVVNIFNTQRSDYDNEPIAQKTIYNGYLIQSKTLKSRKNLEDVVHVAQSKIIEALEFVGDIDKETTILVYDNIYKEQEHRYGFATYDGTKIEVNYKQPHVIYHEIGHNKDFKQTPRPSDSKKFKPICDAFLREVDNYEQELKQLALNQIKYENTTKTESEVLGLFKNIWKREYEYLTSNEEIYARLFYEHIRVNNPHLDLPNPTNPYEQLAEICYENNRELISEYFKSEYPHLIQPMMSEDDFQMSDTLSL
mgnify:CR=1 FL=1